MSSDELVNRWEVWQGIYMEKYVDVLDVSTSDEQAYIRDRCNWKAGIKVLGELVLERTVPPEARE